VSEGAVLVDVRRHDDPGAHLAGSVRIPPDLIPTHLPGFRREVAIVLACT
jgi:rhodanese-related sulfurtransferase